MSHPAVVDPQNPNNQNPPSGQTPGHMEQLIETNARILRELGDLRNQVQGATTQLTAPLPPPPVTQQDYEANPFEATRRMLGELVAPLATTVAQTKRSNDIQEIVRLVKQTPGMEDVSEFESLFAAALGSIQNFNQQSVQSAYYYAKGQYASQPKQTRTSNNPPANQPPRRDIPPHLIPSGPTVDSQPSGLPKLRALNELEQKLSREQRMSHHKWLFRSGEIDEATFKLYEDAKKGGK